MDLQWTLFAVLAPIVTAVLAAVFLRREDPDPVLVIVANGLMPGSGLAIAGRPVIEIIVGVLMAQICMLSLRGQSLELLFPVGLIAAGWAAIYTPYNPLKAQGNPRSQSNEGVPDGRSLPPPRMERVGGMAHFDEKEQTGQETYSVTIRCTECGADVVVPVFQRAALCAFCGSHHLVVGHDDLLHVAIPSSIDHEDDIKRKLLDYYRYRFYLKLYKKKVAPLEARIRGAGPQGGFTGEAEMAAAAEVAEKLVSSRADSYRDKLSATLKVLKTQSFFSPYYHGMGTLYQAAFGRDRRSQDKQLSFSLNNLEKVVSAQNLVTLPEMGKLSYLRSLVPLEDCPETALAVEIQKSTEAIDAAEKDLMSKQLNRELQTIGIGSVFSEEIRAVVWRPWVVASVEAEGRNEIFLMEGASGSVSGEGAFVNPEVLTPLPRPDRDAQLSFQAMECPTCGYEFRYEIDAVLHFCSNCYRVFEATRAGKTEIEYDHGAIREEHEIVPFWRYPLRIRTGEGELLTDFAHLKDGIDGTLDQIGDSAPKRQNALLIPAVRCINPKLMTVAQSRLLMFSLKHPQKLTKGRFPLDVKPDPWPLTLEEEGARSLAPLLLAEVFSPRDIARVKIRQVRSWIFNARLESRGRLCYLSVPRELTLSFRAYVGRYRVSSLPGG